MKDTIDWPAVLVERTVSSEHVLHVAARLAPPEKSARVVALLVGSTSIVPASVSAAMDALLLEVNAVGLSPFLQALQ